MLTLNDGRSELWQWDTGRKLTVDADCTQVHFSNKFFGRSVDVDAVDGVAEIPDVLLQVDKDLLVWAFVGTAENGYTKISKVFKVNKRNKPADYVFTPTEQTTLDEIMKRLDDLESSQDPDAIKNAVDDYLANNPITVKESDPTVPAWAKQPQKPIYTAAEVGALPADTVIPVVPSNVSAFRNDAGYLTEHQDISGKLNASELPTAINTALAQAKESGEFDGKPGYTPQKGVDYFDGQPGKDGVDGKDGSPGQDGSDGITPHIGDNGNWYIGSTDTGKPSRGADGEPGKDGNPGADGYTPVKGKDYFDGEDGQNGSPGKDGADGVSATHSWNGTVLTITSASGTSVADLQGDPGKDGYTPVKGVDYWTDADQEAIVQQVITALGTPVFGRVDAENNIILVGELANGTYTLKYEDGEGKTTDIGTLKIGGASYTNQLDVVGYETGYRLSSSGDPSAVTGSNPTFITGYIRVDDQQTVRLKNCFIDVDGINGPSSADTTDYYGKGCSSLMITLCNSNKGVLNTIAWSGFASSEYITDFVKDSDGHVTQFKINRSGIVYIRLTLGGDAPNAIVTIDEEITE